MSAEQQEETMRIFVDAMGGDLAPQAPVEGTVEALHRNPELTVTLAGIVPEIEKYLAGADDVRSRITLLDAPEVITNHESPVMGVRKKTKISGNTASPARNTTLSTALPCRGTMRTHAPCGTLPMQKPPEKQSGHTPKPFQPYPLTL